MCGKMTSMPLYYTLVLVACSTRPSFLWNFWKGWLARLAWLESSLSLRALFFSHCQPEALISVLSPILVSFRLLLLWFSFFHQIEITSIFEICKFKLYDINIIFTFLQVCKGAFWIHWGAKHLEWGFNMDIFWHFLP